MVFKVFTISHQFLLFRIKIWRYTRQLLEDTNCLCSKPIHVRMDPKLRLTAYDGEPLLINQNIDASLVDFFTLLFQEQSSLIWFIDLANLFQNDVHLIYKQLIICFDISKPVQGLFIA